MTTHSVTVVLWHGQYCNDGKERMAVLERYDRLLFGLREPRLVGRSGHWQIVADAVPYQPRDDDRPAA